MAGIYIHIPFCKQACSYCDFHFSTTFEKYREEMINAICKEIEVEHGYLNDQLVETIYFGGGTPSLLTGEELSRILNTIKNNFETKNVEEITLEANPDDISPEKLASWKKNGINRLSIGLQSFDQYDLDWMNRAHNANESKAAVQLAHKFGFNTTIDLIYGLPNSSIEKLKRNLETAIELCPGHISAYCLTIEEKTTLKAWVQKGKIKPVDEDEQAEQFNYLVRELASNGYIQYEISNFAKNNAYSKHNSNYWKGIHYLGIGPSAHSFNGNSRRWNISNNKKYVDLIQSNEKTYEIEKLSSKNQFNEYVMTGLRTIWGINLKKLSELNEINDAFEKELSHHLDEGLIMLEGEVITLTEKGKLQADHIAASLFI